MGLSCFLFSVNRMTAHAMEQIIPAPMKSLWQKRREVASLIFTDWGSDPPANPVQPKLAALLKALDVRKKTSLNS